MKNLNLKHFDIIGAKNAYKSKQNITEFLRSQHNFNHNTSEIIEISYDLQAGSYIEHAINNKIQIDAYTSELAKILSKYIVKTDSLLDIGTGEITTLSHISNKLTNKPRNIYAFDISWSRIYKGASYAKEIMGNNFPLLTPFVADIKEIPLLDKSIHVTTSSHALEPNGENLSILMAELFRVTINKLVLFEPCYEINSDEGKDRMNKLGYIKNIEDIAIKLGGEITEKIIIKNSSNPLNPTVCFVINPPFSDIRISNSNNSDEDIFSVPGTNFLLSKFENFYFSTSVGLCYPILKEIPILKSKNSILATSLSD